MSLPLAAELSVKKGQELFPNRFASWRQIYLEINPLVIHLLNKHCSLRLLIKSTFG